MIHTAWVFLHSNNNASEISQFVEEYLKKSTDESHKKEVANIAQGFMKLTPGAIVPDVALLNRKEEEVSLLSIIDKPTVIYFWTYGMRGHFKGSHKNALKLKELYPEINFVGVNAEKMSSDNWLDALKQHKFPSENEYRLANPKEAKKQLVISRLNKVMLINKDGSIVHANANMSDHHFEEQLLGMLNQ
jgi:peroxiredoxin